MDIIDSNSTFSAANDDVEKYGKKFPDWKSYQQVIDIEQLKLIGVFLSNDCHLYKWHEKTITKTTFDYEMTI